MKLLNDSLNEYVKRKEISLTIKKEKFILPKKYIYQLELWTKKQCDNLIFDSSKSGWPNEKKDLANLVIEKSQILFIIEDVDGEIFGYYHNTRIESEYGKWSTADENSFQFNLRSNNNRLSGPMLFEMTNKKYGFMIHDSSDVLMNLGNIYLLKGNKRNECYCNTTISFNYHSIKKALCDKTGENERFTPKRLLIIQMN